MSITPLRFIRLGNNRTPSYGHSWYKTHCGRFNIYKQGRQWAISENTFGRWSDWLRNTGLRDELFPTRKDTIAALEAALNVDETKNLRH